MKKLFAILGFVVVVIAAIYVVVSLLFAPVEYVQKRLNEEIAQSLQNENFNVSVVFENLKYKFPNKFAGHAVVGLYIADAVIIVDEVTITPSLKQFFTAFSISGQALDGTFKGFFALGKNFDLYLNFQDFKADAVKTIMAESYFEDLLDFAVTGKLRVSNEKVIAENSFSHIKLSLPPPFNFLGTINFDEARLDFMLNRDELLLQSAFIKNEDVAAEIFGTLFNIYGKNVFLNLNGYVLTTNPIIMAFLNTQFDQTATGGLKFKIQGPWRYPRTEIEAIE